MINNNLNILRLLLSILVFLGHWNILTAYGNQNIIFNLHSHAVNLFFIISGFLIFWSFDRDTNIKHFYLKRFFRIYPIYLILIILQTLFFMYYANGTTMDIVKYFISNAFFLNFLSHSVGDIFNHLEINAINGSLWTLKNEVFFYFLVPFIYTLYKKWGIKLFIIFYMLSAIYMFLAFPYHNETLMILFPAQLRLFIIGILLYIFFNKFQNNNIQFIVLSIVSLISLLLFSGQNIFDYLLYPILLGVFFIVLSYKIKLPKIKFDFSYSFYILHFPIIQLSIYFKLIPDNPLLSFISLFIVVLILSYLSEKYIEKRFIQIGKNIINKEKEK